MLYFYIYIKTDYNEKDHHIPNNLPLIPKTNVATQKPAATPIMVPCTRGNFSRELANPSNCILVDNFRSNN